MIHTKEPLFIHIILEYSYTYILVSVKENKDKVCFPHSILLLFHVFNVFLSLISFILGSFSILTKFLVGSFFYSKYILKTKQPHGHWSL